MPATTPSALANLKTLERVLIVEIKRSRGKGFPYFKPFLFMNQFLIELLIIKSKLQERRSIESIQSISG